MECSVCKTRSSIGYCPDCQQLLCETCGVACADCGVMLCEAHRVSYQGVHVCRRCAQKANAALQHSTPAPRHRAPAVQPPAEVENGSGKKATKEEPKGFSFQDLMEDLEDDGFEYQPRETAPLEEREPLEGEWDTEAVETGGRDAFGVKALVSDDPNEFRVLGNSGKADRDFNFCKKTYYIAGVAFVLLSMLSYFPWLRQQPYVPHLVTLIAASGFFWSGYGIYKFIDEEMRKYFIPSSALNFLFTLWGFLLILIT